VTPSPDSNKLDPYTYRGTDVLINKRDLRDANAARAFEADAAGFRSRTLPDNLRNGELTVDLFRGLHQHIFQDVYPWAGEIRTIDISKGKTSFSRIEQLEPYGTAIFARIANEKQLQGLDKPAFVDALARHYADVNAWHPFREGNGRTTRAFFDILARRAGYRLDFRAVDREEWNRAAEQSFYGNLQGMRDVFAKVARPMRAIAFELGERHSAIARFPELAGAYEMVDAIIRNGTAQFPNNRLARERFTKQARETVQLQLDGGLTPNPQRLNQQLAARQAVAAPAVRPPVQGGRGR